ncbi:XRE family transcriptional regulator [Vibrio fluvialis]|uniref:XRE family transcriptional regulator n=1 Tax=Vibrio fluvialis TaxID=676 RepID=UPI00192C2C8D|nr:XRE family transcriptional regulator [Vibrio fluvialis]EKO3961159.1 XRE family transcriptional regulator [Vibrio fluvialis]MBL4282305.1 XRE family transcriptional regulator [Vibrio fluvialis]MBY8033042.1 XRE family transcriptional regulator [Vibrio fluvialis]MBY8038631.1 XRE family transcriptional regulator [Vibrio fluvialis]MBY8192571.1 XRE family transcriptional regulator [Vibrio fluvialis]
MSFATRLQELIGEESISGFARRVEMSEGLIRKYLKGSEPSLSKANQIAMRANCSLEWLATGCGYLYRQAEVVDMDAYALAHKYVTGNVLSSGDQEQQRLIISGYQYLRAHKKADGYLDETAMAAFLQRHPKELTPSA